MTEEAKLEPAYRLSVIVTAANFLPTLGLSKKAALERSIQSVLSQEDPIGAEIVIADSGAAREETADYLKAAFPDETARGRLQVYPLERILEPGTLRNEAVARSRGVYLAFLDAGDTWKPGRLTGLEPRLKRHDLILATTAPAGEPMIEASDWIRAFVSANYAVPSSAVIRRTLFEEAGGFSKSVLGKAEYEFWVKCLVILVKTERRDRFLLVPNEYVVHESAALPPALQSVEQRIGAFQELIALLRVAPKLPPRHWITLAKRLGTSGKSIFRR